jgi:glycosyltransferase involved in cell wall biosynthesis
MTESSKLLVSVVIPTYNHARFLERALQSVLDQTHVTWEAIVVDNHSIDNTDDVMAKFSDPRVRHLKIHNKGVIAASRNMGIRASNGDWVAFLDSDDWWTETKLEVCLRCADKGFDLVYHDLEIVTEEPRIFQRKVINSWQVKQPVLIDLLERGNAIATSSVMVRRKILTQVNGMNESAALVAAEDYNTWLRIAQVTDRFQYISKRLGYYKIHSKGISQKNMSIPMRHAVTDFLMLLNSKQRNKLDANIGYENGRFSFLHGNYAEAKNSLIKSLRYGPLLVKLKSAFMYAASSFK